MTSFCVFGVSRQVSKMKAEKKVPTFFTLNDKRVDMTAAEWGVKVREFAQADFETSQKQVKISPVFDAPQFCKDWLRVAPGEVRLTQVMARTQKTDEDGNPIVRKGAPVMTWTPYEAMP